MINQEPIYIQLMKNIEDKLINGEYKIGDIIMSEREMAEKYKLARVTVRRALKPLIDKGYLEAIIGRGTCVKSIPKIFRKVKLNNGQSSSLSQIIKDSSKKTLKKIISINKINPSLINIDEFIDEKFLYKIEYIYTTNNISYILNVHYLPESLFFDIFSIDFNKNSLYDFLKDKNKTPKTFVNSMIATEIPEHVSQILNNKKTNIVFYSEYKNYYKKELIDYIQSYQLPEYIEYNYDVTLT